MGFVQFELRELEVTFFTGLGYPVGSARTFVKMINELDGAALILAHVQLADWTVETG